MGDDSVGAKVLRLGDKAVVEVLLVSLVVAGPWEVVIVNEEEDMVTVEEGLLVVMGSVVLMVLVVGLGRISPPKNWTTLL